MPHHILQQILGNPLCVALRRSVPEPQAWTALTDRQTADLIRLAALQPEQRLRSLRSIIMAQLAGFRLSLLQLWGIAVNTDPLEVGVTG